MNQRERTHEENPGSPAAGPGAPGGPGGGGTLRAAREQGAAFAAAGNEAIDNVLSGDSAKFNQAAKQEGGQ